LQSSDQTVQNINTSSILELENGEDREDLAKLGISKN